LELSRWCFSNTWPFQPLFRGRRGAAPEKVPGTKSIFQSDAGAATRETLMRVLLTLQKRSGDPLARLTETLNALADNPDADVYRSLFGADTS